MGLIRAVEDRVGRQRPRTGVPLTANRALILPIVLFAAFALDCKPADHSSTGDNPTIADAVRSGDVAKVRSFTAADRVKALESAAQNGDVEAVKTLLAAGADAQSGMFPAAFMGRTDIVTLLLNAGADPIASDTLMPAATNAPNNAATLAVVLDRAGSRFTPKMRDDLLDEAASAGKTETVKLLLQRGADPIAVMFASGKTPTQVAREHEHFDVVEILNEATKNRPQR